MPGDPENNDIYDQLSAFKLYSLMSINKKINSLMELDTLLDLIMDSTKFLLNTEGSSLMLVNEEKNVLTFNVTKGDKSSILKKIEIPMGKGIAGLVAQTGEAMMINNAQDDPRVFKEADIKTQTTTKNIICVPMKTEGKIIGVLEAINSIDRDSFNDDDMLLLMAMTEQAAISLTNRKLYDKIKMRADELSALYEISQLAISNEDTSNILNHGLKIVARVMNCKKCSIMLYNKDEHKLKIHAAIGIDKNILKKVEVKFNDEISSKVFQSKKSIFTENIEKDPRFGKNKSQRYKTKSFISVLMQTNEKSIGVLNITEKEEGKHFNIYDVRLLQTIANQISEVYENIRLYEEEKIKINIEKELEVTRKLQETILPKHFHEIPGLSIFAMSLPAKEVGGDFYDIFYQGKENFSAIIADVSGKSIPAALFMASARAIIKAQTVSDNKHNPSKIFKKANNFIIEDNDTAMFVTAFLFSCDMKNRKIKYTNGGHNDPLMFRSGSDEIEYLHAKGRPLGIIKNQEFQTKEISFNNGDMMILYTDGIIEANNMNNDEFGIERFEKIVANFRHMPPAELAGKITDEIEKFISGAPQFDDMTLFIFKFE